MAAHAQRLPDTDQGTHHPDYPDYPDFPPEFSIFSGPSPFDLLAIEYDTTTTDGDEDDDHHNRWYRPARISFMMRPWDDASPPRRLCPRAAALEALVLEYFSTALSSFDSPSPSSSQCTGTGTRAEEAREALRRINVLPPRGFQNPRVCDLDDPVVLHEEEALLDKSTKVVADIPFGGRESRQQKKKGKKRRRSRTSSEGQMDGWLGVIQYIATMIPVVLFFSALVVFCIALTQQTRPPQHSPIPLIRNHHHHHYRYNQYQQTSNLPSSTHSHDPNKQTTPTHYDILHVSSHADETEIARAYRATALLVHPDKPGGSAEDMARVNEARAVLADSRARCWYDAAVLGNKGPGVCAVMEMASFFGDDEGEDSGLGEEDEYDEDVGEGVGVDILAQMTQDTILDSNTPPYYHWTPQWPTDNRSRIDAYILTTTTTPITAPRNNTDHNTKKRETSVFDLRTIPKTGRLLVKLLKKVACKVGVVGRWLNWVVEGEWRVPSWCGRHKGSRG